MLKESPIKRTFAQRIGVKARLEAQDQPGASQSLTANKVHCHSLQAPFLVAAVERYDRLAATQSVELRHPLLDRRLMEFCAALPPGQKWERGWPKLIMRRAMDGILPDQVCWRGYSATSLHWDFGYSLFATLGNLLSQLSAHEWHSIAEYANLSQLDWAFKCYQEDPLTDEQWILWQSVFLDSWLQRIISQNAPTIAALAAET
jgi:asparagine synthase (glutamine-hydrolysing)